MTVQTNSNGVNFISTEEKDRRIALVYSDYQVSEELAILVNSGLSIEEARLEVNSFSPVKNRKKRHYSKRMGRPTRIHYRWKIFGS